MQAGPILVGTLLDACRKEIPALCPADVDCAEVFGNALWSYQVESNLFLMLHVFERSICVGTLRHHFAHNMFRCVCVYVYE